jgi:hypothetical protein
VYTATSRFFLQEKSNDKKIEVVFRLLTLADLEWIATENLSAKLANDSALSLLSRCLLQFDGRSEMKSTWAENLEAPQIARIETEIIKHSPHIDLMSEVICPECRYRFTACFDPLAFLLHKLEARAEQLYREIHTLAFWYHWSEADILAMSREKRWRYLHLISEEFSQNTHVEA